MIKGFKNRWNYQNNNNMFNPQKESNVRELISDLCPPWVAPVPPILDQHLYDPFLDSPFSQQELNFVIKNLRLNSSPGIDSIDYRIISSLPQIGLNHLLDIFAFGIFSPECRFGEYRFLVCFIPKNDKCKMRLSRWRLALVKYLKDICNRLIWWVELL